MGISSFNQLCFSADGVVDINISPTTGYTISSPGSYKVVSDVTMTVDSVSAIVVAANNVTIDLGGHTITGFGNPASIADGISAAGFDRVSVSNGRVSSFGGDGIEVGDEAVLRDLVVSANGENGILADLGVLVENCQAHDNNLNGGEAGIQVDDHSIVRNCIALRNSPTGSGAADGIYAGSHCRIEGSIAKENVSTTGTASGIYTSDNCLVINCVSADNVGASSVQGIRVSSSSEVRNCSSSANMATGGRAVGIDAGAGCVVEGNQVSGTRSGGNGDCYGIETGGYSRIANNVSYSNQESPDEDRTAAGITASSGSIITGNVCYRNDYRFTGGTDEGSGFGIDASLGCIVTDNSCYNNTGSAPGNGAGIYAHGQGMRIERNTCNSNGGSGAANAAGILLSSFADDCVVRLNNTWNNDGYGIHFQAGATGSYSSQNLIAETKGYQDDGSNTEGSGDLADLVNPPPTP